MIKYILMKIKTVLESFKSFVFTKKKDEGKQQIIDKIITAEGIDQFFTDNSDRINSPIPLSFYVPPHVEMHKEEVEGDRQRLLNKLRNILKREKR
jgi:hypothetical protein